MDSINWVRRSALGMLCLSVPGGTALAQENAGAMEPVLIEARVKDPIQGGARAGDGQLRGNARSGIIDWETGRFELRGERLKSASNLTDTVRLGKQWQRTYAADVSFRESGTPGIAFEAGARFTRTSSGVTGGPLLTDPTKTVAQMAYVGVQMGDSSSIRLIAFDNGGWSEGVVGQLASRVANGESPARKGAALEIGRSEFRLGNARGQPLLKLRLERGRSAERSHAAATISMKVRL